jgi:hypothetical protein
MPCCSRSINANHREAVQSPAGNDSCAFEFSRLASPKTSFPRSRVGTFFEPLRGMLNQFLIVHRPVQSASKTSATATENPVSDTDAADSPRR